VTVDLIVAQTKVDLDVDVTNVTLDVTTPSTTVIVSGDSVDILISNNPVSLIIGTPANVNLSIDNNPVTLELANINVDILLAAAGPAGLPGSKIFTLSGVPSNSLGADTDFYVDTDNDDYYSKVAGSWVLQGNLEGDQGDQGDQGIQGIPGNDGDIVIITTFTATAGQTTFSIAAAAVSLVGFIVNGSNYIQDVVINPPASGTVVYSGTYVLEAGDDVYIEHLE